MGELTLEKSLESRCHVAVRAEPARADGLALLLRVPLRRPRRLPQVLSHIIYLLISSRRSTPPQNFQIGILINKSK